MDAVCDACKISDKKNGRDRFTVENLLIITPFAVPNPLMEDSTAGYLNLFD